MSTAEIKEEIQRVLEKMPENSLKDVLELLNQVQNKQYITDEKLDAHMNAIISENRGLLQRLAQ